MNDELTPQAKGYQWEREVAQRFDGKPTVGSGNRFYARLDVEGTGFVISAKHTVHDSFSFKGSVMQDARSVAMGPSSGGSGLTVPIVAVKLEPSGLEVAMIEMQQLIDWIKASPQLIQPSKHEKLINQARHNPLGL